MRLRKNARIILCVDDDAKQQRDGKASAQDKGKHFDDGYDFFHVYRIPQITQNARDFFAIKKNLFFA